MARLRRSAPRRAELLDRLVATQHVVSGMPLAFVSTSTISVSPADTIAPIADASAQIPSGHDTFSTLHPAKIRPLAARIAAPTGNPEYGA